MSCWDDDFPDPLNGIGARGRNKVQQGGSFAPTRLELVVSASKTKNLRRDLRILPDLKTGYSLRTYTPPPAIQFPLELEGP